jgi:hypothetical protein
MSIPRFIPLVLAFPLAMSAFLAGCGSDSNGAPSMLRYDSKFSITVVDNDGNPLPNAEVALRNNTGDREYLWRGTTDESGVVTRELPLAEHISEVEVSIFAKGYEGPYTNRAERDRLGYSAPASRTMVKPGALVEMRVQLSERN